MFEQYMGRKQMKLIDDPLTKKGCELWLQRVLSYYGEDGGVDVEIINGQLILNDKTAGHIYSGFTPTEIHYVPGSRPMLEEVVKKKVKKDMSEREKALALMRRCRDNRDHGLARPALFRGGTEEELLKRGALMCNEISRVFICLCQVAGLPARVHCSHISGHMMTEVMTDGKWGWIDPMKGIAPVNDDNHPASAWELLQDPTLFERQPKSVWKDVRPPAVYVGNRERDRINIAFQMARNRDCYFNPREAMAVGNYFVWEFEKYTYPWRIDPAHPKRRLEVQRLEELNRKALGWPDYYFNPLLFDEDIKPRR